MTPIEALTAGLWAMVIAFGLIVIWELLKLLVREIWAWREDGR
jgi:hypothetical protein